MATVRGIGALLGRFLLGIIFVLSGLMKLRHPAGTAAMMATHGVFLPSLLVWPTIAIELVGGLLLIAGAFARPVAFTIFLFMIPTTYLFHVVPGGQLNQIHTLKNLAIMGGLLMVAVNGPGGFSLDRARGSR